MMADREPVVRALKTAKGQIEGILRMVDENRYCVDISNQLLATEALLRKTNKAVLHAHLEHCVKDSFTSATDVDTSIHEIMGLLDKLVR
jgi:DNA-binding FrmR family transcriptional regulator